MTIDSALATINRSLGSVASMTEEIHLRSQQTATGQQVTDHQNAITSQLAQLSSDANELRRRLLSLNDVVTTSQLLEHQKTIVGHLDRISNSSAMYDEDGVSINNKNQRRLQVR